MVFALFLFSSVKIEDLIPTINTVKTLCISDWGYIWGFDGQRRGNWKRLHYPFTRRDENYSIWSIISLLQICQKTTWPLGPPWSFAFLLTCCNNLGKEDPFPEGAKPLWQPLFHNERRWLYRISWTPAFCDSSGESFSFFWPFVSPHPDCHIPRHASRCARRGPGILISSRGL